MRPLAEAAIEAGLVDEETLAQFKRWKLVPKDLEPGEADSTEEVVEALQEALEAEEQVRLQSTDLDVLKLFANKDNRIKGQMVLVAIEDDARAMKTVEFAIREMHGKEELILRWVNEDVTELLTNGRSYLRWKNEAGENRRMYLLDHESLYFGDEKMFIMCTGTEDIDAT